jgi:hypothetical protein
LITQELEVLATGAIHPHRGITLPRNVQHNSRRSARPLAHIQGSFSSES